MNIKENQNNFPLKEITNKNNTTSFGSQTRWYENKEKIDPKKKYNKVRQNQFNLIDKPIKSNS